MSETTIPLRCAWNSWDSDHPAEMQYLPLGLRISPCAYAASVNAFTRFPAAGGGVRLGPRAIDAESAWVELAHAGTELGLTYRKPDPFTLCGAWETRHMQEWGLRFWVVLALRLTPPAGGGAPSEWRFDAETGAMIARTGANHIVVLGERAPLLATFHESLDALQEEFESKGYFYLESRGEAGAVAALRYNLEEMPRFRFAATVANDAGLALRKARAQLEPAINRVISGDAPNGLPQGAISTDIDVPALPAQIGPAAGALDAVRDVVAWNNVWDPINRRSYITASRNWVASKFGGFGVWLDDALYHALMAGLFDAQLARENLQVALAGATPQGNLPCLVTGRDAWLDRSQPPIGAFIVWMLYLRTGARDLITLAFDPLLRNHEWWWRERDGNGDGLVEYGTSAVGAGLYQGTKLAAKDESSMDNSPVHDEATLNHRSRTLDSADVGLNSLLALDGEMLALMAKEIGEPAIAERVGLLTKALRERIAANLWDSERGVFANRLWSGRFVRSLAPTSFYPLLAGAATVEQARAMARLLDDTRKFGGTWLLPSVTRDDPAFGDNVYWRGRIWPPLNFLVYHGLRRYGFEAEAAALAENSYRLFMGEWREHRRCPENFNAVTGAACDQPDTDSFYGWGALLPLMSVAETTDVTPWNGWEVTSGPGEARLGPVLTPAGAATIAQATGCLTVSTAGGWVLRTNLPGRFRRLSLGPLLVRMDLPPVPETSGPYWIELRREHPAEIALARLAGQPIHLEIRGDVLHIALQPSQGRALLELFLSGAPDDAIMAGS